MQRKDGLTKVFKMFLGDIIYKEKRDATDEVLVKAVEYISNDEEFEETEYDYRGNPQYSKMITKLCSYNRRCEFIIEVLVKELHSFPAQQIMILGQNKNILIYLYKAIENRNIASVGYYVGGMKKDDLKSTESKKVIIATYAMAAEALDIKSLTSLFLVTPRTDITQAVGRILRVKHERPLVVDFVDTHKVFKNQWSKRLSFYKKYKYKTMYATNIDYKKDKWNVLYDPSLKLQPPQKTSVKKDSNSLKGKCLIKI